MHFFSDAIGLIFDPQNFVRFCCDESEFRNFNLSVSSCFQTKEKLAEKKILQIFFFIFGNIKSF